MTTDCATIIVPPDPEDMNLNRASWALSAIQAFEKITGSDREDALSDLLCDLMHWADRSGESFDDNLWRARMHYEEETNGGDA